MMALSLGLAISANAARLNIDTASIEEVNQAFAAGLTSEQLVSAYLERIEAYDKQGPVINAVITLNPDALQTARALDAERKRGAVRGPLHGVPIVLKDNHDTFDMPTTAGSQLLEGSVPPADAFIVKQLRDAGAIVLAKVNMSEWAGGAGTCCDVVPPEVARLARVPPGSSSAGGQTRNPHDLARSPAGSSGGTGAEIAAMFAQVGLGTDTGGSIRGPASVNGIVGLKPTNGLLSRSGIVPLSLTFDTSGPMARSVYDVAVTLGVMTGVDPADPLTRTSAGKFAKDYTTALKTDALKGARIGVARQFMGVNAETDRIMEAAIATLREQGAVIVDPIAYPKYLVDVKAPLLDAIYHADFKAQVAQYLQQNTGPGYPKTFQDIVEWSNDPQRGYRDAGKAYGLKYNAATTNVQTDPAYVAAVEHGLPLVKSAMLGVFEKYHLDAIVYPTSAAPAPLIDPPANAGGGAPPSKSATSIANLTGFPDLIVPAGMTSDGLPVSISFFGPAYSEAKLLGYGYAYEQASKAIAIPKNTPPLASDVLTY